MYWKTLASPLIIWLRSFWVSDIGQILKQNYATFFEEIDTVFFVSPSQIRVGHMPWFDLIVENDFRPIFLTTNKSTLCDN